MRERISPAKRYKIENKYHSRAITALAINWILFPMENVQNVLRANINIAIITTNGWRPAAIGKGFHFAIERHSPALGIRKIYSSRYPSHRFVVLISSRVYDLRHTVRIRVLIVNFHIALQSLIGVCACEHTRQNVYDPFLFSTIHYVSA